MNAFIEFLKEYWFQLATGVFAIIEVVLLVVKRKPKSIDDFKLLFNEALSLVPEIVIKAEKPGNGEKKKDYVVWYLISWISNRLGRQLSINEIDLLQTSLGEKVEIVLCTPTKKEKKNEE